MIFLIVSGVILILILLILFCPVSISMAFEDDFSLKVKMLGITVYKIADEPRKEAEEKAVDPVKDYPKTPLYKQLIKKYGHIGAIKETFKMVEAVLEKIKKLLKHVYIRKLYLNVVIATDNAAKTALKYGAACSAVYPVITFICSHANVGIKHINVVSDFNKSESEWNFSTVIKLRVLYALIAAGNVSRVPKF